MKKTVDKRLAVLLALAMLLGCVAGLAETAGATAAEGAKGQLTLADIEEKGAKAYAPDGRVTFVDGDCADAPVQSMEDAAAVVNAMIALLGGDAKLVLQGDEGTRFEPWRSFKDTAGNVYYVFQQMHAGITVPGAAVKVVTDAEGRMLGLVGSLEDNLPDAQEAEGITAQQAEALALQYVKDNYQGEAELIEGRTGKVVLPVKPEIDPNGDGVEEAERRFAWVVYTNNPGSSVESASDLPYLAHYVTLSGEYLYSLPAVMPGDAAATSGFSAAYVFEFMESVPYTGTVMLSDGTEKEITVDLMRDTRTGMYYLGNLQRRIAVADCFEFVYNEGHVVLEASPDNTGWDNTCLLSLYNYCRAWDYYKAIGWNGGDGDGTPILVLKDYCNSYHEPIDNAAYAGQFYGWQLFLSSDINDLSQCLDVLAHEFTHCVTGSIMTYNAYLNDYGAINEAMSDIQGNICEMMNGATEDTTWLLGETGTIPVRCMSDPHMFQQPEYTWDYYYKANVNKPTVLNDQGGVHTNSSLLNNVAWRLCEKGGMTLEEARAFWFAVDGSMVPHTDYAQLSVLMPWVLRNQGLEKYQDALEAAIDATRLRSNDVPDSFDEDRALVTLTLPDEKRFEDGHWGLMILSVDAEGLAQRFNGLVEGKGEYEGQLDAFFETLFSVDGEQEGSVFDKKVLVPRLVMLLRDYFGDLARSNTGVAGQDGRTVRLVTGPGLTIPVLFRLELDDDQHLQSTALAVYTFGQWIDLASLVAPLVQNIDLAKLAEGDLTSVLTDVFKSFDFSNASMESSPLLQAVLGSLFAPKQFISQLLFTIQRGAVNEIPGTGLENVGTLDKESFPLLELLNDQEKLSQLTGQAAASGEDYGDSDLYTQAELEAAAALIREQFESFEGCELHALRYAGDVCNSAGNLQWMNSLEDGKNFTQVVEFLSDFHSPVEGGGAWEADTEYKDWQWWLAREDGGDWQLLTWGY